MRDDDESIADIDSADEFVASGLAEDPDVDSEFDPTRVGRRATPTKPGSTDEHLGWALWYAGHGYPVFPIQPKSKVPLTAHGFKDATTDSATIRRWWNQSPAANIGIPTGDRFDVLDVDLRNGGIKSLTALAEATGIDFRTLLTPIAKTGGGGYHFLFQARAGIKSKAAAFGGRFPGLDTKGAGGYIVVAPSVHASGDRYVWAKDRVLCTLSPAQWPDEILALLAASSELSPNDSADLVEGDDGLTGVAEGSRNSSMTRWIGVWCNRRLSLSQVAVLAPFRNKTNRPPLPDATVADIVERIWRIHQARNGAAGGDWLDPEPLPPGLLPVPTFDSEKLLPPVLRTWVMDIADRAQCPPEFVAVTAVAVFSSIIGRQCGIRPKQFDDWTVVPNLWALVVGRPGILKSPAIHEGLRPLRHLEKLAREDFEKKRAEFEFTQEKEKAGKARLKKQMQETDDPDSLRSEWEALAVEEPVERRFLCSDATVEKLGEILINNANGVMVARDEIAGFLATMDREGHQNDRAFYCEAWSGTGSYTYDRIGRGTLHIPSVCISILGGIQPGRLNQYLREVFSGQGDDGLIQRFQLSVFPDLTPWTKVDRYRNIDARDRIYQIAEKLAELSPSEFGAAIETEAVPYLRFTPKAQAHFDSWLENLEHRIRQDQDEHPVLISHIAKYRSLLPSLALIFHLIEVAGGETPKSVPFQALEMAEAWCAFLEAHARRIYQSVTARGALAVHLLARKILQGKLGSQFRAFTITRTEWSGLTDKAVVGQALDLLVELNWLRAIEQPTTKRGGRPTVTYEVNPKVARAEPEPAGDEEPEEEEEPW